MKKTMLKTAGLFVLAALLAAQGASRAEAWIKITLKNNRSHNIAVAFCWSGFDYSDDQRKGWYVVKPDESRVITLKDAVAAMTWDGFGFYAQGTSKNGRKVTWSGSLKQVIIHPTKAFSGHPDDPIQGGTRVGFRKVNLKRVGDSSTDAVATLTFNP
jgi:hypothetical protein